MDRRNFFSMFAYGAFGMCIPAWLASKRADASTDNDLQETRAMEKGMTDFGLPKKRICVIAVGHAAVRIVSPFLQADLEISQFIAIDTDSKRLAQSGADVCVLLGENQPKPETPHQARAMAVTQRQIILDAVGDLDIVIIVAEMSGPLGLGAAPVVAQFAKSQAFITIGLAVMPFGFEGKKKTRTANAGVRTLLRHSNAVLPLSAEVLTHFIPADAPFFEAVNQAQILARQTFERLFWMFYFTGACSHIGQDLGPMRYWIDGHLLSMGWGIVPRPDGLLEAMDKAINHPDINVGQVQNAEYGQVLMHHSRYMNFKMMGPVFAAISELNSEGEIDFAAGIQFIDGQENVCSVTVLMRRSNTHT